MFLVIDRIENNLAVCIADDGKESIIPLIDIQGSAKESDVLLQKGNLYIIDLSETKKRKKKNSKMLDDLFAGKHLK